MNTKVRFKLDIRTLALQILLVTACLKWLIEGILDRSILELILLVFGLSFAFLKKGLHVNRLALPWALYIVNIVLSLLISKAESNLWGRAAITILITAYVFFVDCPVIQYRRIMRTLVAFGCVTGVFVGIHYLMGDAFGKIYFPFLSETARDMAEMYTRGGYYFGLLYNPHEPAGLIVFAIAGFVIWKMVSRSPRWRYSVVGLVLIVPLLLTGKRAIFAIMLLTLTITILMLYGSRKQWIRGMIFLLSLLVGIVIFIVISMNNPEIAIFNRFNQLFQQVLSRETLGSGRLQLYNVAITEWQKNKWFGIGWRAFNAMTTTKFNFTRAHEVNCDYLQWLCETGIIGFILSIIPVAIMAYRSTYVGRKLLLQFKNKTEQWILLFSVFIQIFTLIYAFVEIPFFDIVYTAIYIISCVIINSAYSRRNHYL